MFEGLGKFKGRGVYVVHSSLFDAFELMNLMAPSFVVGIEKGNYVVAFDPRSTTVSGFFEEAKGEVADYLKKVFGELLEMEVSVSKKSDEFVEDPLREVSEDVEFYEGMGVIVMESSDTPPMRKKEVSKIVDKFRIFTTVSDYSKKQRYSPEEMFLSVSPGMAGMSVFLTLDTRFMIWLKNETKVEGDRFRYALIRSFNVVVNKLTKRFKYESMPMLPYEIMVIVTRNLERLKKFLKAVDDINTNVKPFLKDRFPIWTSQMKTFQSEGYFDFLKSKEEFLDSIAAIPDKKGVESLKNRLNTLIDEFAGQLAVITKELGEWLNEILESS